MLHQQGVNAPVNKGRSKPWILAAETFIYLWFPYSALIPLKQVMTTLASKGRGIGRHPQQPRGDWKLTQITFPEVKAPPCAIKRQSPSENSRALPAAAPALGFQEASDDGRQRDLKPWRTRSASPTLTPLHTAGNPGKAQYHSSGVPPEQANAAARGAAAGRQPLTSTGRAGPRPGRPPGRAPSSQPEPGPGPPRGAGTDADGRGGRARPRRLP